MSRVPAFLAAVAFAAGVWLGAAAWHPPLWWMIALVVCSCGALLLSVRSHPSRTSQGGAPAFAVALLALAALGALDIGAREQSRSIELRDRTLGAYLTGDDVQITAHVLRDSTSRPRGPSISEMVDVESECISVISQSVEPAEARRAAVTEPPPLAFSDEGPSVYATMRKPEKKRPAKPTQPAPATVQPCVPFAAGIRVMVYPHDLGEDEEDDTAGKVRAFHYGQRLRLTARLRPPRNFGNPGAWDYAGYLRDAGILALGSARADRVELLAGFSGSR